MIRITDIMNISTTKFNDIDKESDRYEHIKKALYSSQSGLKPKQQYEMKNILERWILTLANDVQESEDKIFSTRKLNLEYYATKKMLSEMEEKYITNFQDKFNEIISHCSNFLEIESGSTSGIPVELYKNGDDKIIINQYYTRVFPPGKLNILLKMNDSLSDLGKMITRYACLMSGGQQWAIPLEMYKLMVDRYDVTIEGFASPINSQILYLNDKLNYCSIFLDTDQPYGSLGNFFENDFIGKNVYANPPYVLDIMENAVIKIIDTCAKAKLENLYVRFFITVPEWKDAEFYLSLTDSLFLVFEHSFPKNKHHYIDTNNGFKKIPAHFGTHFFVLAANVKDNYDEIISQSEIIFSDGHL